MSFWQKIWGMLVDRDDSERKENREPVRDYRHNLDYFAREFTGAADFVTKELRVGTNGTRAAVLYLDHLADKTKIADTILWPLTTSLLESNIKQSPHLIKQVLHAAETSEIDDLAKAADEILMGQAILILENYPAAISINVRADIGRSVTTAEIETTIYGPKAAFVETISTNLALVRRRLRSRKLKVESIFVGTKSLTTLLLLYIEDIAPPDVVKAARERLHNLNVDEVIDIAELGELMEVSPLSPFPQFLNTERPDKVVANLLEGRLAILFDGSPESLILPTGFSDLFQSPSDYYQRPLIATMIRLLRVMGFVFATVFPALYVALISFNYEVLPTDLTIAVATARAGIPFPPFVEAIIMLLLVDILQEGTTRLPSKIGQTVGVVGGFVLGQAVIQARIVSPLLLIVVATSVIGAFAAPDYRVVDLMRFVRYLALIGGAALGGFGIMAITIGLTLHVCSLEILGVPYLRPVAPLRLGSLSDFIYRRPARRKSPLVSPRLSKGADASE